jgi:predicted nucleic acid-binding protein
MKRIFVDTGAWYALVDKSDPDHPAARRFFAANRTPLATTNFVFDETVTLLRRRLGWQTACEFGRRLKDSELAGMVYVTGEDEDAAWEIFRKFRDKDFSYTDCTSFAVMERLKVKAAFTFDSHFTAMGCQVVPGVRRE